MLLKLDEKWDVPVPEDLSGLVPAELEWEGQLADMQRELQNYVAANGPVPAGRMYAVHKWIYSHPSRWVLCAAMHPDDKGRVNVTFNKLPPEKEPEQAGLDT